MPGNMICTTSFVSKVGRVCSVAFAATVFSSGLMAEKTQPTSTPNFPAPPLSPALKLEGPSMQKDSDYWLSIRVVEVQMVKHTVNAKAEVIKAFKFKEELKEGETISIVYDAPPPPPRSKGKGSVPPMPPTGAPPLRPDQQTFAFMKKNAETGNFEPSADIWSFAPPFGIPQEELAKVGMKMPGPPSRPAPNSKQKIPPFLSSPPKKMGEQSEKPPAPPKDEGAE